MSVPSKSASHRVRREQRVVRPEHDAVRRSLSRADKLRREYFGDEPDKSMYTFSLWGATEIASSCQGPRMGEDDRHSGKSAATSSTRIGFEYFSRMPRRRAGRLRSPTGVEGAGSASLRQ